MTPALEQHERIKMRLRLAGSSLADVARELSVAATTVTTVSQGFRRSRRIEAAIAAKLGVPPQALWRDRYPDGPPKIGADTAAPFDFQGGAPLSPVYC